MCELLVGLPDVYVLGVDDVVGGPLRVHVRCRGSRPACPGCGGRVEVKDHAQVEYVDLSVFGRQCRLVWHKHRWLCPAAGCATRSWTAGDTRIAWPRMAMTDRAGRWVTEQVGRHARSVNEIATELGCDWHTINDTVLAYGTALVDDPARFGVVEALGLDEVLFARVGPFHRLDFSTQIVDVKVGQLLDVVPGRSGKKPTEWLEAKGKPWRDQVRFATLDMSGAYRAVFNEMVPGATQIADPFHVVKLANSRLDECRRRVQGETMGHRGRKSDPLYRCRRLLTKADERLNEQGKDKLLGLLAAGDPDGEVATAWQAKEAVRAIYSHTDADLAMAWLERLTADLGASGQPREVRLLARTLLRWKHQIVAWHRGHVSNGPTEAVNNLIKRVKRAAFGFTRFTNYRIRSLLYAGKPNWDILTTITPRWDLLAKTKPA
ncbi:MAG: ISL3 family transposase [Actinomycetes bacterium]